MSHKAVLIMWSSSSLGADFDISGLLTSSDLLENMQAARGATNIAAAMFLYARVDSPKIQ